MSGLNGFDQSSSPLSRDYTRGTGPGRRYDAASWGDNEGNGGNPSGHRQGSGGSGGDYETSEGLFTARQTHAIASIVAREVAAAIAADRARRGAVDHGGGVTLVRRQGWERYRSALEGAGAVMKIIKPYAFWGAIALAATFTMMKQVLS